MRRATLLFAAWLPLALSACSERSADGQTWRTLTSERQVSSREPLEVQVEYGAGTLRIAPAAAPALYRFQARYDENVATPTVEFDQRQNRLHFGMQGRSGGRRNIREGATASLELTREVPMELTLHFGAGKADIQLGGIGLRRLAISTGASETTVGFDLPNPVAAERVSIEAGAADLRVTGLGNTRATSISFQGGVGATVLDFTGQWSGSTTASVQMGVGSVTLRFPRSLGVRINRNSVLTSFSAPGMERQGNSYLSGNWGAAPHQLTIELNAALGSVDVQWVD